MAEALCKVLGCAVVGDLRALFFLLERTSLLWMMLELDLRLLASGFCKFLSVFCDMRDYCRVVRNSATYLLLNYRWSPIALYTLSFRELCTTLDAAPVSLLATSELLTSVWCTR